MVLASRVAVTTTLSACSAGLTSVFIAKLAEGAFSVERMGNGILAGLVGVTANCHIVEAWGAICIGLISSIVYFGSSKFLMYNGIDDPLDAVPVHGFCGVWGLIAGALFG